MRVSASVAARLGAFLFAAFALLSCTVAVEQPMPPRPGPQPGFCTREFAPVCGERRGDRQTFSNACLADRAGYRIVRHGQCTSEAGPRPGICTREYAPVCGERRGNRQTFGNSCLAEQAGFRVTGRGECRPAGGGGVGSRPGICTREYAPVCGRRGNDMRTFGNQCEADVAGYRVISGGACRPSGGSGGIGGGTGGNRVCTAQYLPVCARRGSSVRTFGNQCEADLAGFRTVAQGPC